MNKEKLILASNSPRRKELIALLQLPFTVNPGNVDETIEMGENAQAYVCRLALAKARAISAPQGQVIIAADTVVVDEGEILGKPLDAADAARMLKQLRGHTHTVMTAITLLEGSSGRVLSDLCVTDVPMRNYSDAEIAAYVVSGDPLDKAGAYAIQHAGFKPVENLDGCYASVMGLPLCHITKGLQALGIEVPVDIARSCQAKLAYDCRVHAGILSN